MPKLTVLMTVFNGLPYLKDAIESVLDQTFRNFEFIIIDDASTDQSFAVTESFKDPRIRLIRNKQNIGQTRSLNHGIAISSGDYIARMDQDDISLPNRLARQMAFLEAHPEVALLGTWYDIIAADGRHIKTVAGPPRHDDIVHTMILKNPFAHTSVVFCRDAALSVGGYPEGFSVGQDRVFWIYISRRYRVANLPEVLTRVRRHNAQVTRSPAFNIIQKREFVEIMRISGKNRPMSSRLRRDWRTRIVKAMLQHARALEEGGQRLPALRRRLEGYLLYPDVWLRNWVRKSKQK